jgi:hypothetical protein
MRQRGPRLRWRMPVWRTVGRVTSVIITKFLKMGRTAQKNARQAYNLRNYCKAGKFLQLEFGDFSPFWPIVALACFFSATFAPLIERTT